MYKTYWNVDKIYETVYPFFLPKITSAMSSLAAQWNLDFVKISGVKFIKENELQCITKKKYIGLFVEHRTQPGMFVYQCSASTYVSY